MKEKGRNILYVLLIIIFMTIFLYAVYQVAAYIKEMIDSQRLVEDLTDLVVIVNEDPAEEKKPSVDKSGNIESEEEEEQQAPMEDVVPIKVDFDVLKQTNEDVKAWLYCENTMINYPVAQAEDNDYYLHRLLNGNYNRGGTLFVEYSNQDDFSDWNTLIYGHNMKNNTMFGTLTDYNSQEYYDEHPVWYLLTPEGDYKIELIAGYVTDTSAEIYSIPQSVEEKDALVESIMRKSTFATKAEISSEDRLITFSTCTYEYDEARYVLVGVLKKVE